MERRFTNKVNMNATQGNILMQQIRLEHKNYKPRKQPIFINSHRDEAISGKRVFKENLYQTTCLYKNEECNRRRLCSQSRSQSVSPAKSGKRVYTNGQETTETAKSRGKRLFLKKIYDNQSLKLDFSPRNVRTHNRPGKSSQKRSPSPSPIRYGRKRLDNSPSNQNRLSPGFQLG